MLNDGTGVLTLVATPIGNLDDLTLRGAAVLRAATVLVCEDTRRTGRLLQHLGARPERLIVANAHTEARAATEVCALLDQGVDVAVVSDAGLPGVSDPGGRLVAEAIEAGHRVTVAPGASAVGASLVVSGLAIERYCFEGFLPRRGASRGARLQSIAAEPRTSVVFESPNRLAATLVDLVEVCGPDRRAAVVRELTKLHEEIDRGTLGELAARWSDPTKGEVVLVVEGAPRQDVSDDVLRAELAALLAQGRSRRDAVTEVATLHDAAKNRVYGLAIELDSAPDGG